MRKRVEKWRPAAFQGIEIDGFIVGGSIVPTPKEAAKPLKGESPHGGLMGRALVTLLLGVGAGPAGLSRGFSRPCDERLSQELWALKTPVDPGLVAAPCGHGGNASVLLPLIGGDGAIAWFAEGDEETRGKDGASAWERVKYREVGMALGALGKGLVELLDRVQGHAALGDEGLDSRALGVMTPSSVVSGVALLMAWRRW